MTLEVYHAEPGANSLKVLLSNRVFDEVLAEKRAGKSR